MVVVLALENLIQNTASSSFLSLCKLEKAPISQDTSICWNRCSIMILLAQNPSWPIFCKILELHTYYNKVYF